MNLHKTTKVFVTCICLLLLSSDSPGTEPPSPDLPRILEKLRENNSRLLNRIEHQIDNDTVFFKAYKPISE